MQAAQSFGARARHAVGSVGPLSLLLLVLAAAGGVLLIVAELSTIYEVDVLTTGTCEELADPDVRDTCHAGGFEQHGGAFALLGLLAIAMAVGVARGRSRPAAGALVVVGAIVLAFALLRDLPQSQEDGLLEPLYDEGMAKAGLGLYLEIVGGALCVAAGALALASARR